MKTIKVVWFQTYRDAIAKVCDKPVKGIESIFRRASDEERKGIQELFKEACSNPEQGNPDVIIGNVHFFVTVCRYEKGSKLYGYVAIVSSPSGRSFIRHSKDEDEFAAFITAETR